MVDLLHTDTLTVKREVKERNKHGRIERTLKIIYEDIPCRLSQRTLHGTTESTINSSDNVYKVFLGNEYEIMQNDTLEVVKNGISYKFLSGKPISYSLIPHQEIMVREVEKNES